MNYKMKNFENNESFVLNFDSSDNKDLLRLIMLYITK